MLATLVLALMAQAPPPPATQLKVLVLDVISSDLTESERTTLTNLEAAHLSEDPRLEVLSGEDLKQLVKLQGQAQEIGVEGKCADACMAELAGALGAGIVISTQAGKLGDTLVVTLVVFDAAKAKGVSRKSIQATSLGELPGKLGPALDALVRPLLPALPTTTTTTAPVSAPVTTNAMSPRLQELYDVEAIQVCVDEKERAAWWFCNRKQAFTENAFVRNYRSLTGAEDLDRADLDRSGSSVLAPIALFTLAAAGVGGLGVVFACGLGTECGAEAHDALDPNDGLGLGVLVAGALTFVGGLTGGVIVLSEAQDPDGTPQMHGLSEGEGRGAITRYNEALKVKLARDLGE